MLFTMATILNAYDLAGGDTASSEVVNASNVSVHWVWGGTQAGTVKLTWKVKDGSDNYVALKDENRKPFEVTLFSAIDAHMEDRWAIYGVNSASLKIYVEPSADATGTLSLFTYEA